MLFLLKSDSASSSPAMTNVTLTIGERPTTSHVVDPPVKRIGEVGVQTTLILFGHCQVSIKVCLDTKATITPCLFPRLSGVTSETLRNSDFPYSWRMALCAPRG
jgi:hypothetical protein